MCLAHIMSREGDVRDVVFQTFFCYQSFFGLPIRDVLVTTKTPSSVPEESVIIQPVMWAKHILILTRDYVLSACSFERLVRFKLSCLVSGFNCWGLWLRNRTL